MQTFITVSLPYEASRLRQFRLLKSPFCSEECVTAESKLYENIKRCLLAGTAVILNVSARQNKVKRHAGNPPKKGCLPPPRKV